MYRSPGLPSVPAARALSRQPNGLARQDALGHLHVQHALPRGQVALGVDLGNAQREGARSARQRRVQVEHDLRVVVFTPIGGTAAREPAVLTRPRVSRADGVRCGRRSGRRRGPRGKPGPCGGRVKGGWEGRGGVPGERAAGGEQEGGGEGKEPGEKDGGVDCGGREAAGDGGDLRQRGGAGGEIGEGAGGELGQRGLAGVGGLRGPGAGRVEPDRGPLGRGGFGGDGGGGDLGGIDLEDAELARARGGTGSGAQGAFGVARAGLAGSDELAGKLDQVRGQRHGRAGGLFKDGRLAEGDLFIEPVGFGVVAVFLPGLEAGDGGGAGDERCGRAGGALDGVFEETDGEAGECGGAGLRVGAGVVRAGLGGPSLDDEKSAAEDGAPGFVAERARGAGAGWASGQRVSSCGRWAGDWSWVWLRGSWAV